MSVSAQVLGFLAPIFSLLAALIAVKGNTWDSQKSGLLRIAASGYLAILIAVSACIVGVLAFEESRSTEMKLAERERALQQLGQEKLAASQKRITFYLYYLASSLPSEPQEGDKTANVFEWLRSEPVVSGLAEFDFCKPTAIGSIFGNAGDEYETTWAIWLRSWMTRSIEQLTRTLQIFGQYLDVETSAAVLDVLESDFVLKNDEFFGDSAIFNTLQRQGTPESLKGSTGPVGIARLSGFERNIFGFAVAYRQFITALEVLAERTATSVKKAEAQ